MAFTYIEGELAAGVIRNYEWIVGHSGGPWGQISSCKAHSDS